MAATIYVGVVVDLWSWGWRLTGLGGAASCSSSWVAAKGCGNRRRRMAEWWGGEQTGGAVIDFIVVIHAVTDLGGSPTGISLRCWGLGQGNASLVARGVWSVGNHEQRADVTPCTTRPRAVDVNHECDGGFPGFGAHGGAGGTVRKLQADGCGVARVKRT